MSGEVRVALAGVGNCAAAFVRGIEYYRREGAETVLGLITPQLGGYSIADIRVVAAFDVSKSKVGRDLGDAIRTETICTRRVCDVNQMGVTVSSGPVLDGIGGNAEAVIELHRDAQASIEPEAIAKILQETGADVLVNFLPVGSRKGTEFYARSALKARCGFVNAIPVPIGRDPKWRTAFSEAAQPLIGDDVKSQVGATIVHRALVELFSMRGYELDRTYQLNVGGNMDFFNMTSSERLADKRISKAQAILDVANRGEGMTPGTYHISPSDHISFLEDRKIAFIRLEGRGFAGAPIDIEVRMCVEDSPNSAGIIVDAVRYAKVARDRGEGGYLVPISSWLMKAPAFPSPDAEAKKACDAWVAGGMSSGSP